MQYPQLIFFSDDTFLKDDIDKLFENLQQIEPPSSLIERILTNLPPRIPSMPADSLFPESIIWEGLELDGLIVRNDKRKPC